MLVRGAQRPDAALVHPARYGPGNPLVGMLQSNGWQVLIVSNAFTPGSVG